MQTETTPTPIVNLNPELVKDEKMSPRVIPSENQLYRQLVKKLTDSMQDMRRANPTSGALLICKNELGEFQVYTNSSTMNQIWQSQLPNGFQGLVNAYLKEHPEVYLRKSQDTAPVTKNIIVIGNSNKTNYNRLTNIMRANASSLPLQKSIQKTQAKDKTEAAKRIERVLEAYVNETRIKEEAERKEQHTLLQKLEQDTKQRQEIQEIVQTYLKKSTQPQQ